MNRLISFLFLLSFMTSCASPQTGPEPAPVTHTYVASDTFILNPERGFFTPYTLPSSAGFSAIRITGNTLVHLNIRLDDYRESDIPEEILNGLQTNFDDIREAGVKAIIRFAYNQGPFPDTEPDASKSQILKHIEQLTPLLQTNADVIAWAEAGFIGAWGEWHTSTNGLDNIVDKRQILFALLKALPETRKVQVRYPSDIIEIYPEVIGLRQAANGIDDQVRVGHHNDCFLSSDTDVGTYERDGVNTIVGDQAYLTVLTRYTPMSGETCAPNPPRSECTSALQEMALLHFSAINEAYHKGILRSWDADAGGCMEEITNRLGYRLTLMSADFNEQVRPGGLLNLTVNLQNTGFASLVNKRPLYFVLVSSDGASRYEIPAYLDEIDPRIWLDGEYLFSVKLHIPSNAPEGEYQLALWLPDDYESLRNDPRYSVRFANENVWDEATGLNILGNVSIAEVGGETDRGKEFSIIESSSKKVIPLPISTPTFAPTAISTLEATVDEESLILNIQILNQDTSMTIKFDFAGKVEGYNGFQVFLDIDQDPATGFSSNGIGADYLLENGILNVYAGQGGDWNWSPTSDEILFDNSNNAAQWIFDGAEFGKLVAIDFVCQLADTNWDTVFVSEKQSYTLK